MYVNDLVKMRTMPCQVLAKQRARTSPLRVGTDVMKIREQRTETIQPKDVAFADSDYISDKFDKNAEVPAIYSVSKGGITVTVEYNINEETNEFAQIASITDGSGKKLQSFIVTDDTRIRQGTDGSLSILTGQDALSQGKLTGSDGDIILRVSGADVKVERGDVAVINFGQGGTFDGGDGTMMYTGEYCKATFTGGSGGNTFGSAIDPNSSQVRARGAFSYCTITAADGKNEYAGYFEGSVVEGGAGSDTFSGIFTDNSTLNGNDGNDSFTGYFKLSNLSGGKGKNTFQYVNQAGDKAGLDSFADASTQFFHVNIDAGESSVMHGVFEGATITLKSGAHKISGAFLDSTVDNQEAEAVSIDAFYAFGTQFIGENGSSKLTVHSGEHVTVDLGTGDNAVSLGAQKNNSVFKFLGGNVNLSETRFYRKGSDLHRQEAGTGHGTLDGIEVNATKGTTALDINTGLEHASQYYSQGNSNAVKEHSHDTADAEPPAELAELPQQEQEQGMSNAEAESLFYKDIRKTIEYSLDATEYSYEYLGMKNKRSKGVVPVTGIDEAVEVKTSYGFNRYYQEKNERLRHTREISLFTTRYDWQI